MELILIGLIAFGLVSGGWMVVRHGPALVAGILGKDGDEASRSAPAEGAPVPLRWWDRLTSWWRSAGGHSGSGGNRSGGAPDPLAGVAPGVPSWRFPRPDRSGTGAAPPTRPERPAPVDGRTPERPPATPEPEQPGPGPRRGAWRPPVSEPPPSQPRPEPEPDAPTEPTFDVQPRTPSPRPPAPSPETIRTRSWRDDRTGPQVQTSPTLTAIAPGGAMGEIATSSGGGVATSSGGSLAAPEKGSLVAGDVRIGDIRGYSYEVQAGAEQLQSLLSGIGPTGLALVAEFMHVADNMRQIANILTSNANKTGDDGWDAATVAAARHMAARATAEAQQAETDATDLQDFLTTRRARQRELARQLAEAAQNTITTVDDGHGRLERAVKENPVQPAPRTEQYANR